MKRLPSFSVILVFVVLSIAGAAMIPLLNIQYTPTQKGSSITVSYAWAGASARLVESEVTSVIEGVAGSISGVSEVSSISRKESGSVTVTIKDKSDMEMIRFELSSRIRRIYNKLPEGVSYPLLSGNTSGADMEPIMTYTVNADMPTQQIDSYVRENIVGQLAVIDGVNDVRLSGATPYCHEICFLPERMSAVGVTVDELAAAVSVVLRGGDAAGMVDGTPLILTTDAGMTEIEDIPIKNAAGRIIRVKDVATVAYREMQPESFYRINGLNTINITIYPEQYVNTMELCRQIRAAMEDVSARFPENLSATAIQDTSVELGSELEKIVRRTVLSLVILLLFVLITSRSWRYLVSITLSLAANVLISFIFYVLFNLEIHLFSLAGITVSLGIIIDTAIVMISHYGYYRNRKAFIPILAAQLTTIGALAVIFLLPEQQRADLTDFAGVIIINLAVSLFISMLLVPALWDKMCGGCAESFSKPRNLRRVIKLNDLYFRYISFIRKHRWITFVALILLFGVPFGRLPDSVGSAARAYSSETAPNDSIFERVYNATLGSDFFNRKLKRKLDLMFGGTFRLFLQNSSSSMNQRPQKQMLSIRASMPDGCTISQLNDVMLSMENFLLQFDCIEIFTTRVLGYNDASIVVEFKEDSGLASRYALKQEVIVKAIDSGGANWNVSGVDDQAFSNNIAGGGYKAYSVSFAGYNYDELYSYCSNWIERISHNIRVNGAEITSGGSRFARSRATSEYYIDYDPIALAAQGKDRSAAYLALRNQLYNKHVGRRSGGDVDVDVYVTGEGQLRFDVWNLMNEYLPAGDSTMLMFSSLGEISRKESGLDISRRNQQYSLAVEFDFDGSDLHARRFIEDEVEWLNEVLLPVGYSAKKGSNAIGIGSGRWNAVPLLLIVIAIIYFICAILFESLLYPLAIIGLVPVSFIGVWIVFAATRCSFDQGGFASLIFLCGLVVNAGVYLISEYNGQKNGHPHRRQRSSYVRACNHKITPVLLTVLSTLIGLVPFLFDGVGEVFWFPFALGTMGGLAFSLIALLLFMPAWIRMDD